ncbi:MAG: CRISPR-associated protein Csx16 [Rhodocyclaceae bacterium]|nr:CRISPR-associated protein Csx16 [Rhodocyclaceae bacterium]
MTLWFVTRHPGALDWARQNSIAFDRHVVHLDPAKVSAGDTVIGSLPVNLAFEVCERGAEYWNLSLRLEPADRGRELTADDLERCGARIEAFRIERAGA